MRDFIDNLERLIKRVKTTRVAERLIRFSLLAFCFFLLFLLLERFISFPLRIPSLLPWMVIGGAIYGLISSLTQRVFPMEVAKFIDRKYHLKERIVSALELRDSSNQDEWVKALIRDADIHLREIKPEEAFLLSLERPLKSFLIFLSLLLLLLLLTHFNLPFSREGNLAEKIKEEGTRLEELGREMEMNSKEEGLREIEEIAGKMRRLGEEMGSGSLELKEALKGLRGLSSEAEMKKSLREPGAFLKEGYRDRVNNKGGERRGSLRYPFKEGKGYSYFLGKIKRYLYELEEGELRGERFQELSEDLKKMERIFSADRSIKEKAREASKHISSRNKEDALKALKKLEGDMEGKRKEAELRELERVEEELKRSEERLSQAGSLLGRGTKEEGHQYSPSSTGNESSNISASKEGGTFAGKGRSPQPWQDPTERIETAKIDSLIESESRTKGGDALNIDTYGPGVESKSKLPYWPQYPHYKMIAEEALTKEEVPLGYREYVRDYFKSLEPK